MFKHESITPENYPILVEWWEKHNMSPVAMDMLPPLGMIIKKNKTPVYAIFIYLTGTGFAWLGWEVSNPDALPEQKRGALEYGINQYIPGLKKMGVKVIITTTYHKGLVNSLKKINFIVAETNVVQLIKKI